MARESAGTPGTLTLISAALLELHAETTAGTITEATLAAIAEEISSRGSSLDVSHLEPRPMPETPDFERIARGLLSRSGDRSVATFGSPSGYCAVIPFLEYARGRRPAGP